MIFDPENNDKFNDEKEDFFDGPDIPETPPQPKKPNYQPDDPAYWDQEESEWEHLKPRSPRKPRLWAFLAFVLLALGITVWLSFFSPYVDEAAQYGYVESVEKRGTVFKTYEGVLLPYKELNDTSRTYTRDFIFSVPDRKNFIALRKAQRLARPVRVEYRIYRQPLPWRGEARTVVVAVDSVDPALILPPGADVSLPHR